MSAFGGAREVCWACNKSVYQNDPQWNYNGKIHKACARCTDCGCTLNLTNMCTVKSDGKQIPVCTTHNTARVKNHKQAGLITSQCGSIMSEAMQRALATAPAPGSARKGVNVKSTAADIDSKAPAVEESTTVAADKSAADETAPQTADQTPSDTAEDNNNAMSHLVEDLQDEDENTQLRAFWEISNLAKEEGTIEKLAAPELGLLAQLAKILISSDSQESKAAAAGVLWNLSVTGDNRTHMVAPDIGLLPALARATSSSHRDTSHRALGALHNISLSPDAQVAFSSQTELFDSIAQLTNGDDDQIADQAVGVLWNVTTCETNRDVVGKHTSLLNALVQGLKRPKTESSDLPSKILIVFYYLTLLASNRPLLGALPGLFSNMFSCMEGDQEIAVKVCGIMVNLSSAAENKEVMAHSSVLSALTKILGDGDSPVDLRSKAAGALWNLSVLSSNRTIMTKPELGLVSSIVDILAAPEKEDNEMAEVIIKCCVILQNMAGAKECHGDLIAAANGGVPRSLIKQMLTGSADARMKAFGAIVNLSLTTESQTALGNAEGAFRALYLMVADETAGDNRNRACGVLHNLSVNAIFRPLIPKQPGLLDTLMTVILSGGPLRKFALGLTLNLCVAAENKPLVGKAAGLVPAAIECMKTTSTADEQVKAASMIWSLCSDQGTKEALTQENELIVSLTAAAGRGGDVGAKAMGALSNLAPKIKITAPSA
jgi:hypothetical protein